MHMTVNAIHLKNIVLFFLYISKMEVTVFTRILDIFFSQKQIWLMFYYTKNYWWCFIIPRTIDGVLLDQKYSVTPLLCKVAVIVFWSRVTLFFYSVGNKLLLGKEGKERYANIESTFLEKYHYIHLTSYYFIYDLNKMFWQR